MKAISPWVRIAVLTAAVSASLMAVCDESSPAAERMVREVATAGSADAGMRDQRMDLLLSCPPAIARIRPERVVEEANFAVRLPETWDSSPFAKSLNEGKKADYFDKSAIYRFSSKAGDEWLAVEYMKLHPWHPTDDNIERWVLYPMIITGEPNLMAPEGMKQKTIWFKQIPRRDPVFLAEHHADSMCIFMGQVEIGGASRLASALCLNRGQESWRIVLVAHADFSFDNDGDHPETRKITKTIGRVFGTFRILSDKRIDPNPDAGATTVNPQVPARGE